MHDPSSGPRRHPAVCWMHAKTSPVEGTFLLEREIADQPSAGPPGDSTMSSAWGVIAFEQRSHCIERVAEAVAIA